MRGAAFSFAVPVPPVATGVGTPSFTTPLTRTVVYLAENTPPPAELEPAVHPDK